MRIIVLATVLALAVSTVSSGQAPRAGASASPAAKSYASAGDVAAVVAKLRADRKDNQALVSQSLLQLAPYNVSIEYRAAVANAAVHDKEAELFYVIDGSATLTTGGTLVGATRPNPDNATGTAIQGGTSQHVAKGDFAMVPEGVPHWFSAIDGSVTLMSLHLPRSDSRK